jgi:hypothetical protein
MRCTYAARMIAVRNQKFQTLEFVELLHRASFLSAFHISGSSPAILNERNQRVARIR